MIRKLLLAAALCLLAAPALAQNTTCATRANGDSSNACASTAFVQNAFAGGSAIPLTQYHFLIGNSLDKAADTALGGDCTYTTSYGIVCTKTNNVSFAPSATTDTTNASNIASGTLNTARLPSPFTSGTRSGNTTNFVTSTGSLTNGHCAEWDASGNAIDAGSACGGSSNVFTSGLSFGTGASTPATADLYGYNATRSILFQYDRDEILNAGDSIGSFQWEGQNASGTTKDWADVYGGPPLCRGKPSFAGFPCATGVVTAGTEEGAVYLTVNDFTNSLSLATNATTSVGSAVLHFASSVQDSGNLVGKVVADTTAAAAIPAGAKVIGETATTITINTNVVSPGVGSGDTITFTGPDMSWFDTNGLNIGGQRNIYLPAGFGIVMPDSSGTATYVLSFNSHGNNALDFQSNNNIGISPSSGPAMRFFVTGSGTNGPLIQLNYDKTITMGFFNGTTSGTRAVCMDSSSRLVEATGTTCP